MRRFLPALALLALAACQEPSPPATGPTSRDQNWNICKDPNRGLAAAEACTALLQAGQETRQTTIYAHYNRAMALSRRGRFEAAIADYDAALRLDPAFALALYQRGLLFQSLGQQIRADQDLMRASQLDPRLR